MSGLFLTEVVFDSLSSLAAFARQRAERATYDGKSTIQNQVLISSCRHRYRVSPAVLATVIYTRDVGHHESGWWKNPDYERCRHLSLSFQTVGARPSALPHDKAASREIAEAIFGADARLAWIEGPSSAHGKSHGVWHYRVFCDPSWAAILPRGEVYSREHTPADWRSFSEIHGWTPGPDDAPFLAGGAAP